MRGLNELERYRQSLLQDRFSELLGWEKTKRRERILAAAFFYSVLASVIAFSIRDLLPSWVNPLHLAPLLFLALAPSFFLLDPWGKKESIRTLFLLDKALHLEERALTSWEILSRKESKATELLVLKEAEEKLSVIDPKLLFKKRISWQALSVLPISLLLLLFVWFDGGVDLDKNVNPSLHSLALKLKQFSHDLQQKAKTHGLSESLKIAQALEQLADKRLREKMSEKELSEDLSGMAGKIGDTDQGNQQESGVPFAATTREALLDLKVELEALRPALPHDSTKWGQGLGPNILGKLDALPRLRGEVERGLTPIEKLDHKELSEYLERLEKAVTAELDRRTLQEIREFLSSVLKGGEGKEGGEATREAVEAGAGDFSQQQRVTGKGTLPGNQPGIKEESPQIPPFNASAATHLKGLLGEGKSSSVTMKGEPSARQSKITEQEVMTSYRSQAEEELASERIPESLKETVRRYFLSLGMMGEKNK